MVNKMVKICPYCHEEVKVRNGQQFGAHIRNCKLNPKRKETINKIKESSIKKKIFKLTCKCGKSFDVFVTEYQYQKGNYKKHCSKSCASIYSYGGRHNELTRKKISEAVRKKFSTFSKEKKRQMTKKAIEKLKEKARKRNRNLLFSLWDDLPLNLKRKRVLSEQNGRCLCGINEWNGKPITFHFDHIDGNSKNDSRENVRFLCPNCHSQTKTYCGNKQNLPQFEYLRTTKIKNSAVAQSVEHTTDNCGVRWFETIRRYQE